MHIGRAFLVASFLGSSIFVGGCATMPASGPASPDIWGAQANSATLPYTVLEVTPRVTAVLAKNAPRLLAFADRRRPSDIRFGIGDVVSVTIFEATAGGLFIPAEAGVRPGNFITIPR